MSHFGCEFPAKTPDLVEQRRTALDQYANLAQISQIIVHSIILFGNFILSVPARKLAGKSQKYNGVALARVASSLKFKMGGTVGRGYGT
jgi:hypothetical protein